MYMKLLEEAVRELKGEEIEDEARATVNLRVDLKIEDSYIPDMNQRLMVYRKVAAARSEKEISCVLDDVRDRYGAPPDSVLNLAEYARIRVLADHLGVDSIERDGRTVVIRFRPQPKVDPTRLIKVIHSQPGTVLVPPAALKLDLDARGETPRAAPRGRLGGLSASQDRQSSWWTARATAGTVEAGFTKEEILKQPEGNPRSAGGVFSRLEELLRALG
jgi:transcription-repair coupling factor (superfamily II helicase)